MGANTQIEWATHTFNPWVGCTAVSPACDFCYAESWAKRTGHPELWKGERRRTSVSYWQQPIKWNREAEAVGTRKRVFCASLADVFDNQVPTRWRDDLWHRIEQTPHLDWLLLTKRPQNISKMLPTEAIGTKPWGLGWPNVWLGTTAENQTEANRRVRVLLQTPAAVRFVSAEPLLGPIDFTRLIREEASRAYVDNALDGFRSNGCGGTFGPKLDQIIVGGESGRGARPMHPQWARSIRDQCAAADVAFFFKQWGTWVTEDQSPQDITLPGVSRLAWATRKTDGAWGGDKTSVYRVSKAAAGRLLDGVEHNETPEARR